MFNSFITRWQKDGPKPWLEHNEESNIRRDVRSISNVETEMNRKIEAWYKQEAKDLDGAISQYIFPF